MQKFTRHILCVLCLVAVSSSAAGQVPELITNSKFRPDAKAAVDSIYNFNFSGADKVLAPWQEKYPKHPLWTLFEGIKYWWQVLSDLEDTSHDQHFYNMMKKADYQAGKLLHDQPRHADGLIIRAISNGYMARQYANRSEWVTSINYGRQAMHAYEALLQQRPDLKDLKLAEGLKLYYLAYIPEAYPIVKTVSWALPDGNKQRGLELIRKASEEAVFAGAEATYFLGNINYNYENNYRIAVQNFRKLYEQYPHNNYYLRILVKSYYKQHRYDEALSLIDRAMAKWKRQELPYQQVVQEELLTWKGRILQNRGRDQQALSCYHRAFTTGQELPNTPNRSFYVVSGYLAGKLLFEQQKFEAAKSYLKKITGAHAESDYRERARELLSKMS